MGIDLFLTSSLSFGSVGSRFEETMFSIDANVYPRVVILDCRIAIRRMFERCCESDVER
jgi:hypothetical protein